MAITSFNPLSGFTLEINQGHLRAIQNVLGKFKNKLPEVVSRGINKTLLHTRTMMVRHLAKDLALTQTYLRSQMPIRRAHRTFWLGRIKIYDRRPRLKEFRPKPTQKIGGVAYTIHKGKREFIAYNPVTTPVFVSPRGNVLSRMVGGVVRRRYPVTILRGPSLGYLVGKDSSFLKIVESDTKENFRKNINQQIAAILKRGK
jgi:hypothetical protein